MAAPRPEDRDDAPRRIQTIHPSIRRNGSMLPLAVAVFLGLGGCGGDGAAGGDPDPSGAAEPSTPQASQPAQAPDEAGVRQTGPNAWEVVIYSWDGGFDPSEIRVPVGAEITFRLTSRDQNHGYLILDTPVELDVFPAGFTEAVHTFEEPGEYEVICHIYCGGGHDFMRGKVIVEPAGGA